LEPAGDYEAVAAVAPLAADDDDSSTAARRAEHRQRADDRVGRAAAGILHERGAGDAELGDRPLIEPPHLLGGEDAQHGYLAVGSGTACARKSARIATYMSRQSRRAARGNSMCNARRGSLRIPSRLAPDAA